MCWSLIVSRGRVLRAFSIRVLLEAVWAALNRFPLGDAQHTNFDTELETVRNGWKQLMALLVLPTALVPSAKASGAAGVASASASAAAAASRDRMNF